VGRHLVVLKNEAHDTVGTYGVTIEAGQTTTQQLIVE
jgi:hypothetical protein